MSVPTVQFDEATHRLRLDAASFVALAELDPDVATTAEGQSKSEKDAALAALRASGAIADNRPHDGLRPGLAAVSRPLARLEVVVSGGGGVRLHQG